MCVTEEQTSQESHSACVGYCKVSLNMPLLPIGTSEVEGVMRWNCHPCVRLFLHRRCTPTVFHPPTPLIKFFNTNFSTPLICNALCKIPSKYGC